MVIYVLQQISDKISISFTDVDAIYYCLHLNFDKLYFHVFGDAPRITCHFTVLQEFKTQVINCLDGQAV